VVTSPDIPQNLYIANHAYCIDGWEVETSQKEIQELLDHASQPKYTCEVEWENPTDLGESCPYKNWPGLGRTRHALKISVIWDNTCTL
jgi:hypothetical protein